MSGSNEQRAGAVERESRASDSAVDRGAKGADGWPKAGSEGSVVSRAPAYPDRAVNVCSHAARLRSVRPGVREVGPLRDQHDRRTSGCTTP